MKKLFSIFLFICQSAIILAQFQIGVIASSGRYNKKVIVTPVTYTVDSLNAMFTRAFVMSQANAKDGTGNAVTDTSDCIYVYDAKGSGRKGTASIWNPVSSGSITNGVSYQVKYGSITYNSVTYTDRQMFMGVSGVTTFTTVSGTPIVLDYSHYVSVVTSATSGPTYKCITPIAGANWGDWPRYFSDSYGGYAKVFNLFNCGIAIEAESDVAQPNEFLYVVRLEGSPIQEQMISGYQAPGYKFYNDNITGMVGIDGTGSINALATNKGQMPRGRLSVLLIRLNTGGAGEVLIMDTTGTFVTQGTFSFTAVGIRNILIGSGGHSMNQNVYGLWYNFGRFTSDQIAKLSIVANYLYPATTYPNTPSCVPTITKSGTVFTLHPNYIKGGLGLPIDNTSTSVEWYYGDQVQSQLAGNTGNSLDYQKFIRKTDGNTLTLDVSVYTQVQSTDIVMMGIKTCDTGGNCSKTYQTTAPSVY